MGIIELEDIAGAYDPNGHYIYCFKCMGDVRDYAEEDIILSSEIENADVTYWCDLCKETL